MVAPPWRVGRWTRSYLPVQQLTMVSSEGVADTSTIGHFISEARTTAMSRAW